MPSYSLVGLREDWALYKRLMHVSNLVGRAKGFLRTKPFNQERVRSIEHLRQTKETLLGWLRIEDCMGASESHELHIR